MLIDSPRLTPRDREVWASREDYDRLLSGALPLDEMEAKAIDVIRGFAEPGGCYASTSWGKDSTVVAHLVAESGLDIPLVWVRVEEWENPDCPAVRDAFFERHPRIRGLYEEIVVPATAQRWWDDNGGEATSKRTSRGGFQQAEKRHGARHISGIRAEESRVRRIAQARWGDASAKACRPIGRWEATDVFAYLHARELPVHPAYAQSVGGAMDRRWLRVSSLGGVRGSDRGRAEWETKYYPDVVGGHP